MLLSSILCSTQVFYEVNAKVLGPLHFIRGINIVTCLGDWDAGLDW
jgi:hypothetical protein